MKKKEHKKLRASVSAFVADSGESVQICSCGTCREAAEAAQKMLVQMSEHQCPTWALQVTLGAMYLLGECFGKDMLNVSSEVMRQSMRQGMGEETQRLMHEAQGRRMRQEFGG
jgi:hypothetical protein